MLLAHWCRMLWAAFLLAAPLDCAHLPIKIYTVADGLPSDRINNIVRDSRGFLWFCTPEGLARFDGQTFMTYGPKDGLPAHSVRDLLESRTGDYWVATSHGLVRYRPKSAKRFETFSSPGDSRSNSISTLLEDRNGTLWLGTLNGLHKYDPATSTVREVEIGLANRNPDDRVVMALFEDRTGALWVATRPSLYRWQSDGRAESIRDIANVTSFAEDRHGRVWIGTWNGVLHVYTPGQDWATRLRISLGTGRVDNPVWGLLHTSDDNHWVATEVGLHQATSPALDGTPFRTYTRAHGLTESHLTAVAEDNAGNIWVGSNGGGAMRLSRSGLWTYSGVDGLSPKGPSQILESRTGQLLLVGPGPDHQRGAIHALNRQRFSLIDPSFRRAVKYMGWGWGQVAVHDRNRDWWFATGGGVYRFAAARVDTLRDARPKAVYTTKDGLASNDIFRIFEDSSGDVWMATSSIGKWGVSQWVRSSGSFRHYDIPRWATRFGEDYLGNVWIGTGEGAARVRGGHIEWFREAEGIPKGWINDIYSDRSGRLWIASATGLVRSDNVRAERPVFTRIAETGLSSNNVQCITEDSFGRLYFGTGRGLDRFDDKTGRITHFTTIDGLPGPVLLCYRDAQSHLWFSGSRGVSQLKPAAEKQLIKPAVRVTRLRISGVTQPLSDVGESELSEIKLDPDQRHVEIEFASANFASGERPRYQYTLDGFDRDWSMPSDQRSVTYASLSPGRYRFLVRVVWPDDMVSATPASVQFTIARPIWQTWWFRALLFVAVASIAYLAHRIRVRHLLAVERLRTQIASDLHDDIGSSLSQIAVLSEVVRWRMGSPDPAVAQPLSRITDVSRGLVDSMSDIVWAINPKYEHLSDLVYRMRRFAGELLTPKDIEFELTTNGADDIPLEPAARRDVFLIFKESLHNAIRHSGCTHVRVEIGLEKASLSLRLIDNGLGFDVGEHAHGGHGLESMRRRAARLGGTLTLTSSNGRGTVVELHVATTRRHYMNRWRRRHLFRLT